MTFEMKLNDKPFESIKNSEKTIELRLYDEKRSKIQLNDFIVFHRITNMDETLKVKVIGLLRYNSFEDLFKDIDYNLSGKANSVEEKLANIHEIYSEEEEKQNGVLGIKIEMI